MAKKKIKCWDREGSKGRYTVCEGSKGQAGVYQKKGERKKKEEKRPEPKTAKEYKERLGKKIKDMTAEEKKKYGRMRTAESRARK